jgi:hypothetical protein
MINTKISETIVHYARKSMREMMGILNAIVLGNREDQSLKSFPKKQLKYIPFSSTFA